ncbi:MAG: protein kinase [Planctomyces sp.]|nr:protein kinase [Planctomyces sp.]
MTSLPLTAALPVPPQRRWIWPFELLEQIGEGGMGVVYRARYVVNNREVAVKMLPGDVTDKTVLARFERELEVLKSLKHTNIVRCFGGICEDKNRFYAMELVTSGTLESELQRRGKLPWEAVVQYGQQICAALECAHRQGVVHRDVKPSNFLLTADGQLKLSDFGLAMMSAARKITQAGKTAGTFLYMAPEQIRGQEVTRRTDLYALGCVFFELLTGRPPFVGETPAATLHMHLKSPAPRVSQLVLDCPASLDQIVSKLMEKDAANRFDSAEEVAKALRGVTTTIQIRTPRRSLVVPTRGSDTETREVVPLKAQAVSGNRSFPFWVTSALAVCLTSSLVGHLYSWQNATVAENWERTWTGSLTVSDTSVRVHALRTLGTAPHLTKVGVEAITDSLNDPAQEVRIAAAIALGDAGAVARPKLPTLIKMQKEHSDGAVRSAVNESIKRINDAPARTRFNTWFLSVLLMLGTAVGLGWWYRMATPIVAPQPAKPSFPSARAFG